MFHTWLMDNANQPDRRNSSNGVTYAGFFLKKKEKKIQRQDLLSAVPCQQLRSFLHKNAGSRSTHPTLRPPAQPERSAPNQSIGIRMKINCRGEWHTGRRIGTRSALVLCALCVLIQHPILCHLYLSHSVQ
jgi:hypothetical protein